MSIAVMDSPLDAYPDVQRFSEDLLLFLGTGDPYEVIDLDTSVSSGDDSNSVMKRSVVIAAGMTDILFVNEEYYEEMDSMEGLLDWKTILGDDYARYEPLFDEKGRFVVSDSDVWKSYNMTSYEPVYAAVLQAAPHLQSVAALPAFFLQ